MMANPSSNVFYFGTVKLIKYSVIKRYKSKLKPVLIRFRKQRIHHIRISGSHYNGDSISPAADWSPVCKYTEIPNTNATVSPQILLLRTLKEYFTFTKWSLSAK